MADDGGMQERRVLFTFSFFIIDSSDFTIRVPFNSLSEDKRGTRERIPSVTFSTVESTDQGGLRQRTKAGKFAFPLSHFFGLQSSVGIPLLIFMLLPSICLFLFYSILCRC